GFRDEGGLVENSIAGFRGICQGAAVGEEFGPGDDAPDGWSVTGGPWGGVAFTGGRVGWAGGGGAALLVACAVPAAPGVPVTAGPAVAVGRWPGIVSTCPTDSELGSAMLFTRTMSSTVTPNISAMPDS